MAEPPPPVVTVRGGTSAPPPGPAPPYRTVWLPRLLGLAALAVVLAAVLGQRQSPVPSPDCGERCGQPLPVVIGAALPLTGVLAPFGRAQQRGVEQAIGRVNAAGGLDVDGQRRSVELLVRDTRSLPDVAGQQALILVRGPFRLVALLGPCSPPVAMVRVAESRQVPLVTGCQPLPPLGPVERRYVWEVSPAEPDRAAAVFEAVSAARGRRVALFLSNDWSGDAYTAAAERAGFTVVGTYRPQGQDWGPAVALADVQEPDVVVAITQPPEGIALWRELGARDVDPEASYASEAGLGSAWYAAVGPAGDGTLTDAVHGAEDEGRPADPDDAVTTVSAELTQVLLDALQRAASSQRLEVNDALVGASGSVAGQPVRFLGDHASRLPVRLARWQDGRLLPLPPAR